VLLILCDWTFDGNFANAEVAVNDFRKTGIFPLQSNILDQADFNAQRQREGHHPWETIKIRTTISCQQPFCMCQKCCQLQAYGTSKTVRRGGSVAVVTKSPNKQK
jgi:hypothetical protein